MITISKFTLGFAFTSLILSGVMLYQLYSAVDVGNYNRVVSAALIYALSMFVSGFAWGYFEPVTKKSVVQDCFTILQHI